MDSVLNDEVTSLPQGSEGFKFKFRNQYEDVLFRTEDDMYKIDFEINNFKKTMRVLQEEIEKIEKMSDE